MSGKRSKQLRRIAVEEGIKHKSDCPQGVTQTRFMLMVQTGVKRMYSRLPWNKRHAMLIKYPMSVNPGLRTHAVNTGA